MKHDESQKIMDSPEHSTVLIEVRGLELGRRWSCRQSKQTDVLSEEGLESEMTLNQVFFQMAGAAEVCNPEETRFQGGRESCLQIFDMGEEWHWRMEVIRRASSAG